MDGIDASLAACETAPARNRPAGIFLHAGWRSCGTWIWERLRENATIQAFYEPLHEDLARLRARDIGQLRPDSWQSGHGTGAPYFAEYAALLRPHGGVNHYARRFAFDDYFRPAAQHDAELELYLRELIAEAGRNGRLPVLKFCRSLGRVPWLEARFPDMLHAVILRDPQTQWRSARRQMEQNGNRYFVVAPFVILARNADHPLLRQAAESLGVRWPPRLGSVFARDLGVTTDACWRHVSRLSWQERFRGFLAVWVAGGIASIQGGATLIDADRLASEPLLRGAAEAALASAVGAPVDLMPRITENGDAEPWKQTDGFLALQAAQAFLETNDACVPENRLAVLAAKLQRPEKSGATGTLPGARHAGWLAYADAAAYVALMRASYPLRRAHFHVRRWKDRDFDGK